MKNKMFKLKIINRDDYKLFYYQKGNNIIHTLFRIEREKNKLRFINTGCFGIYIKIQPIFII